VTKEEWKDLARGNVERNLSVEGAEDMSEEEVADAIYEDAYTLALDALLDASYPDLEEARAIASSVALSFSQP
jgi:hypothetical protein